MRLYCRPICRLLCIIVPLVFTCLAGGLAFGVEFITFEFDAPEFKPNGFMSIESSHVSFTDSVFETLAVEGPIPESNFTNALAVYDDGDGSVLEMDFDCLVTTLSLDFGNDDPQSTNPGDLAVLMTYLGNTQVGFSTVVLNRDDAMNQSISSIGLPFNRATFAYTDPSGLPFTGGGAFVGLIELVDNIRFQCVPEPASLVLLTLAVTTGLFCLGNRRRGI